MNTFTKTFVGLIAGLIIVVTSFGFSPPTDTVIIGVPGTSPEQAQKQIEEGITRFVSAAKPGTRIEIFDASTPQRLCAFEIPSVRSVRARQNRLRAEIAPVLQHLRQAHSVRAGQGSHIDVPTFMDVVGSTVRSGGTTRVILFGSPFHATASEPRFNFGPGQFPSDAHIGASSHDSIFGTSDKADRLAGVVVDWALTGEVGAPREQAPVRRFWHLFLSQQGSVLGSFLVSHDVVVERALEGLTDPVTAEVLDASDERLRILSINSPAPEPKPEPETPSEPVEPEPVEVEPVIVEPVEQVQESLPEPVVSTDVAMVICIDGTVSMTPELPRAGEMLLRVAELARVSGDSLEIAVVVYRSPGNFDVFELSAISPEEGCPGMKRLEEFVREKRKVVTIVESAGHESGGAPTGETVMQPAMSGLLGYADFEGGVRQAVEILDSASANRRILIVAGDVATAESDAEFHTVSDEDRASEARTRGLVRALVDAHPETSVMVLFTGAQRVGLAHRDITIRAFRDLAATAGDRGLYTTDFDAVETSVVRAIVRD